jgi:hypothetical protein
MKRFFSRICLTAIILFALLVISFIIWRVNLAHDVNAKLQAIRAAGLPTSGAELNAYYPAVPDNENAALVMTQAFALVRDFPDIRSNEVAHFEIPPRGQPLITGQKQLLADYVAMNSAALTKVSEAVKLPKSRYPVDFSLGLPGVHSDWKSFRGLTRASEFQALLALDSGRSVGADIPIKNILGMARTLDEEPMLFSYAARMGLIGIATETLQARLNSDNLNEAELADLDSDFAVAEKTNLLVRAIIGERAIAIQYFRMNPAYLQLLSESTGQPMSPNRYRIVAWVIGFFERDLRYYLSVIDTKIAIASLPPPHKGDYKKVQDFAGRHYYIMTALCLPAMPYETPFNLVDHTLAELHFTRTALAVERFRLAHGRLPEKLNELVPQFLSVVPIDPFDGAPLRYHRLAKGYVIYSVGQDGHDDGGREKPADWKSSDKSTYDITFTVER